MKDKTQGVNLKDKKYSKDNILKSKAYKGDKDLVDALLESNKSYTKKEVDKLIEDYNRNEV